MVLRSLLAELQSSQQVVGGGMGPYVIEIQGMCNLIQRLEAENLEQQKKGGWPSGR